MPSSPIKPTEGESGDAISSHLHNATVSLHSLLLLFAEAGFDTLSSETLQDILLKLVSEITNAARLFTKHQKMYNQSIEQCNELGQTLRQLSPLVKFQQEQIKGLRADLNEYENKAMPTAAAATATIATMTDGNISAIEEQLLVARTELWLKDKIIADDKERFVAAMQSYKQKLAKARARSERVVEDTNRVLEVQQEVIDELRDDLDRYKQECKMLRLSLLRTKGPILTTGEQPHSVVGSVKEFERSTEYPEIFGTTINPNDNPRDMFDNPYTTNLSVSLTLPKPSGPIASESVRATEELSNQNGIEHQLKDDIGQQLNKTIDTDSLEKKGNNALDIEGKEDSDAQEGNYFSKVSVDSTSTRDTAIDSDDNNSEMSYQHDVYSGSDDNKFDDRNDDENFDVMLDSSGEYQVKKGSKERYANIASDDGSEVNYDDICGASHSKAIHTEIGEQDDNSTYEEGDNAEDVHHMFWESAELRNDFPVGLNDVHRKQSNVRHMSEQLVPPRWVHSSGSIVVEDSFAMIQNYYS